MNRNLLVGAVRDRLKRLPAPFDNYFGVVPLPPTEETITLGSARPAHSEALECIGRADQLARQFPDHFFLSRILVRQEAVASSAIEGTHSTLDHLLEVEEGDEPELYGDDDADTQQVRSYALVLETALSAIERNSYDSFSIGLIRDLQREVVKDNPDYEYIPGEVRGLNHIVFIGGGHINRSDYNPCPPAYIEQCLEDQLNYLRCTGLQQLNQSIIVRMAVAHAHFEAVHPFPDGNGRTGRLLLPLLLAADGHTPLYLAPYIASNRPSYMDALRAAQQRLEFAPLIEVLSKAIISSVDTAGAAQMDLEVLRSSWNDRRRWRANSTAKRSLDLLIGYPVITANRLAKALNVSEPAANNAIGQLAKAGILKEKTGYRRNRIFAAQEVLDIYNRPV